MLGAPPERGQPDLGGLGTLRLAFGIPGGEGLEAEAINAAFAGQVWIRVSGGLGASPSSATHHLDTFRQVA